MKMRVGKSMESLNHRRDEEKNRQRKRNQLHLIQVKRGCHQQLHNQLRRPIYIMNLSISKWTIKHETAQNTDLKHEARSLFDNATKSIGRLAGNDESLNLNLKDMFSEVFKPHTKNEADEIFIAGTAKTTPAICDISEEWGSHGSFLEYSSLSQ